MNELNYASFEASQKLVDNGIKLITDCVWCPRSLIPSQSDEWILITNVRFSREYYETDPCIPAPSMAEVWRELPSVIHKHQLTLKHEKDQIIAGYSFREDWLYYCRDVNPTDALIDLLIWLKGEKK